MDGDVPKGSPGLFCPPSTAPSVRWSALTRFLSPLYVLLIAGALLGLAAPAAADTDDWHFLGYFDFAMVYDHPAQGPRIWSFHQHHLNLLTTYDISPTWRVFGHVEYEHGPQIEEGQGSGEIALEESWIEYRVDASFHARAGKILAPFGLYNAVEDRTWLFHFTTLPVSVYGKHALVPSLPAQALYAKHATGLEASLAREVSPGNFEGHFYVGNGRGEDPSGDDDNSNKGIGWRLALTDRNERWSLGHSFYRDRNGVAAQSLQTHFGADLTLAPRGTSTGWVLLGECNFSWIRPADPAAPEGRYRGGYADLLYKTTGAWTPWVRIELTSESADRPGDGETIYAAGAAYDANDHIRLKASASYSPVADEALGRLSLSSWF